MAQSRLEKLGTIYSRVTGLYKTGKIVPMLLGAINQEQIPLWYQIYEAFPPKHEPRWDRQPLGRPVNKILYKEDIIRAKFFQTFGDKEVVNLTSSQKLVSDVFVDKYRELSQTDLPSDQLWDTTVQALELEGVDFAKLSRRPADRSRDEKGETFRVEPSKISFKELFSSDPKEFN